MTIVSNVIAVKLVQSPKDSFCKNKLSPSACIILTFERLVHPLNALLPMWTPLTCSTTNEVKLVHLSNALSPIDII